MVGCISLDTEEGRCSLDNGLGVLRRDRGYMGVGGGLFEEGLDGRGLRIAV